VRIGKRRQNKRPGIYPAYYLYHERGYLGFAVLRRLASRDLRREALFLWMMPLVAARSRALIALATVVVATSAGSLVIAATACLTAVRVRVRTRRLMTRRRSWTRADFSAGKGSLLRFYEGCSSWHTENITFITLALCLHSSCLASYRGGRCDRLDRPRYRVHASDALNPRVQAAKLLKTLHLYRHVNRYRPIVVDVGL